MLRVSFAGKEFKKSTFGLFRRYGSWFTRRCGPTNFSSFVFSFPCSYKVRNPNIRFPTCILYNLTDLGRFVSPSNARFLLSSKFVASLLLSDLKSISTFVNIRLSCSTSPINSILHRTMEPDRNFYRNALAMNQSSLYFIQQNYTTNLHSLEARGSLHQRLQPRIFNILSNVATLTKLRLTLVPLLDQAARVHIYSSLTQLRNLELSHGKNTFDHRDLQAIARYLPRLISLNIMDEFARYRRNTSDRSHVEQSTRALVSLSNLQYLYCNIEFDYRQLTQLQVICSCHLPQEPPPGYFAQSGNLKPIFLVPRNGPTTYLNYLALLYIQNRSWTDAIRSASPELSARLLSIRNYPNDESLLDMVISGTKTPLESIYDRIKFLLEAGADPSCASDVTGWNSFHMALMQSHTRPETLDLLFDAAVKRCGSEKEAGRLLAHNRVNGMNVLMLICSRPYYASTWTWLVRNDKLSQIFDISINESDRNGWTALHYACYARPASAKVVKRLLGLGASVTCRTNDNEMLPKDVAGANPTGRHLLQNRRGAPPLL